MFKRLQLSIFFVLIFSLSTTTLASTYPIYIGDTVYPIIQNYLELDSNGSNGNIGIIFGEALAEQILWDTDGGDGSGIFLISDSVQVQDKLCVGGTAPASTMHVYENSVNVDSLAGITIENEGVGDSLVQFLLTGVQRWVVGVDNDDSDKFKIASSADLATDAMLTIDTLGNILIGSTLTLHDDYIKDTGPINLQPSSDNDDYLYLSTSTDLLALFWEGITANDPGIRINASNELEYRDENEAPWTTFDSMSGAGASIFGTEFQKAESEVVSTNLTDVFANKVTLVTSDLPSGTYRIGISYGWNHDNDTSDFEGRIQLNAVDLGEIHKQEPKDKDGTWGVTGVTQRYYLSRTYFETLSGVNTITIDYRSDISGKASSVWDASIELWRVE
ncbi:hypothetical protein ACFL21_00400 [Patescibacteria group bacterium]